MTSRRSAWSEKPPDVDVKLMCDFNQAQSLGDALNRCHGLDDQGLYLVRGADRL